MTVDEKVPVTRRLVLTHTRLHQRRVGQGRESLAQDGTRPRDPRGTRRTIHRRGVYHLAGGIVRDLETAAVVWRNAVHESRAEMHPHRQRIVARVAAGRAEK